MLWQGKTSESWPSQLYYLAVISSRPRQFFVGEERCEPETDLRISGFAVLFLAVLAPRRACKCRCVAGERFIFALTLSSGS